jgi:hypothetical protein
MKATYTSAWKVTMEKLQTPNIQRRKSNIQHRMSNSDPATFRNPFDVHCWMLDVRCSPAETAHLSFTRNGAAVYRSDMQPPREADRFARR